MNSFAAVIFFAALAAANAALIAPLAYSAIPTGHIVQGPSSRTTVVGPDGSAISSVAPGGAIVTDHGATVIAQAAPAAVIAPAARLAVAHAPLVAAHSSLVAAPALTAYAAHAPVLAHHTVGVPALAGIAAENTVVAGPSGTITQSRALDAASHVTVW